MAKKLTLQWSPRQIAGWLKRAYPDDERFKVPHETIYRTLFIQRPRGLKEGASQALAAAPHHASLAPSHAKDSGSRPHHRGRLDPEHPRHWEGDLLFGAKGSQIGTLVERHTRYVMLTKVKSKGTETVINALIQQAHTLPRELYQSLTGERGKEMADHRRFSLAPDIKSTSVIRATPGGVVPTRTPTDC